MGRPACIAACLSLCLSATPALAEEASAPAPSSIRAFAERHAAQTEFSGTILVSRNGRTLYAGSFGLAERAFGTPASADIRYPIASITKLFTAALILQLVDQHRLDLDAPVSAYLTDYPGGGAARVRIRHLLNHTSGLAQFDTVQSYQEAFADGLPAYQRPLSTEALLRLCCGGALARPPGQKFEYNNADYLVLGRIIERLAGSTYEDALRARILEPLGMRDSGMMHWDAPVPRLASTYFFRDDSRAFVRDMPVYWENWYAAGGMYSTAADLAIFADALYGGEIISAASQRELLAPGQDEYGLGLWSYSFERAGRTRRVAKRPGSIMGANSVLYRLLDEEVSTILLANTNRADLDLFAQRIAETVIDELAL